MGSLILCHKKKAKHPYEISRIHTRISTLEELCYYLCNNLYLIDYTIMNEQLCRWIADELEMQDLAVKLVELIRNHGSVEKFVVLVLERQKYKADEVMESGELESAILVYMSIVNGEKDDSVDKRFYGRVSACLAGAYGRAFLYEESARMYEKAYKICEDNKMLEGYLYASSRYMPQDEYQKMVMGNEILLEIDNKLTEKIEKVRENINIEPSKELFEEWKKEYRRA